MKKLFVLSLLALAVTGCTNTQTDNQPAAKSAAVTTTAPAPQADFRFSHEENVDIANPNKLSWRVFYDKPSTGPDAAWFDAVKKGDLATVKYMVENGQNLEAKDVGSLEQTALGWAAFIGYEDMVDYLIEQGASLHATDKGDVYNVMKSAVLGKNTNIVKKVHTLLNAEKPVDLNDQTVEDDRETLLIVAASNNRLETTQYLIDQGANVNLVSTKDHSAMSFACANGHSEMVALLAKHGAVNHRTGKANCQ
ncbi:ankyrin repeat domain-containing protein [Moraxella nasibovis]|uniref:ankyrin repeat domain-containing protein n=1 Tax=Moraxella nasibovis TaxID=2904120 RepID=UPI00240F8F9E|nr:ankyrin repeat domain-containing protein [Moraxella nasibovis]WFF38289.1 ankyrin repeat domain-containing protein [Moraxella nasibovis]